MTTPRIEEMVVKKDGQDTWEIRYGTFVKGGIFLHDLPKFINDVLNQALTKAHQAGYADGYKQGKFDAEVTAEYGEPEALQDNK